nr:probable thimet oligopeptidase [Ipomoea trifida]
MFVDGKVRIDKTYPAGFMVEKFINHLSFQMLFQFLRQMRTSTYFMIPNDDSVFPRLEMKRQRLIQLRHKLARLLGYANFAEYATDVRMASSSSKVFELLKNVSTNLTDLASRELAMLKNKGMLWIVTDLTSPFGLEER